VGLLGPGPHVVRRCHAHQRPDEAPGVAEGTVATQQHFCFVFAVASYLSFLPDSPIVHSVVLPTIFEKYIHTKIEANSLKSVAYITPEIHVPLYNPFVPKLSFSCFIISMTPFGVNGTERVNCYFQYY